MNKHTVIVAVACVAFVALCIGVLFVQWLMVPLLICLIALNIWSDELPLWSIFHPLVLVAETIAMSCAFASVWLHPSQSIPTVTTVAPTLHQQLLQFGYTLVGTSVVLLVGGLLKPAFNERIAPIIQRKLVARALRDMEYYRIKD